jgi:hypothetical protein
MKFVKNNGTVVEIVSLLPGYGFGANYYLRPREISLDPEGNTLTFITPVMETLDEMAGTVKDWGDTLCTVDLRTGTMVSMEPLSQPMTQWSGVLSSSDAQTLGQSLEVTVARQGAQVTAQALEYPLDCLQVSLGPDGLTINHQASEQMWDDAFQQLGYGKAYTALERLKLPKVTDDNFSPVNTQEQRDQAAQYFQVTLNGQSVSGNLWWSQGNGHTDLNFDFDQPVSLSDGDVLQVWMGMPE